MSEDRVLDGVKFSKLRDLDDLELAEALRDFLRKEGIGAMISGDESVQSLPTEERHREAAKQNLNLRLDVPSELRAEADRLLKALEDDAFGGE